MADAAPSPQPDSTAMRGLGPSEATSSTGTLSSGAIAVHCLRVLPRKGANIVGLALRLSRIAPSPSAVLGAMRARKPQAVNLSNTETQHSNTDTQLSSTQTRHSNTDTQLSNTETQHSNTDTQLFNTQHSNTDTQLSNPETQLSNTDTQLSNTDTQGHPDHGSESHSYRQDKGPFTCMDCGASCFTRKSFSSHTSLHKSKKPFSCSICKNAFALPTHLKEHMTKHLASRRRIKKPLKSINQAQKPSVPGYKPSVQGEVPGDKPCVLGDKPCVLGDKPSVPGYKPSVQEEVPGDKPSVPGDKPSVPGDKPSVLGDKPSVPGDKPSVPGDKPCVPGDKPSVPGDKPCVPGDKPRLVVHKTCVSAQPSIHAYKPSVLADNSSFPAYKLKVSAKKPIFSADKPRVAAKKPRISADNPRGSVDNSSFPPYIPKCSLSANSSSCPAYKPKVSAKNHRVSADNSSFPANQPKVSAKKPKVSLSADKLSVHVRQSSITTQSPTFSACKLKVSENKPKVLPKELGVPTHKPSIPTQTVTPSFPAHKPSAIQTKDKSLTDDTLPVEGHMKVNTGQRPSRGAQQLSVSACEMFEADVICSRTVVVGGVTRFILAFRCKVCFKLFNVLEDFDAHRNHTLPGSPKSTTAADTPSQGDGISREDAGSVKLEPTERSGDEEDAGSVKLEPTERNGDEEDDVTVKFEPGCSPLHQSRDLNNTAPSEAWEVISVNSDVETVSSSCSDCETGDSEHLPYGNEHSQSNHYLPVSTDHVLSQGSRIPDILQTECDQNVENDSLQGKMSSDTGSAFSAARTAPFSADTEQSGDLLPEVVLKQEPVTFDSSQQQCSSFPLHSETERSPSLCETMECEVPSRDTEQSGDLIPEVVIKQEPVSENDVTFDSGQQQCSSFPLHSETERSSSFCAGLQDEAGIFPVYLFHNASNTQSKTSHTSMDVFL
ncbi:uncharacterized protein [Littorina saxatilis]|uniref:C2H2-type domain-containing protein n=1 Tax=Littorina saxatilis TaxID=31220 RepID=A0AAN9G4G0_9CAEN